MPEPQSMLPPSFTTKQVVQRFVARLALLAMVASFSTQGFAKSLVILAGVAAIFCSLMAAMRAEPLLGPRLTYWDEGAVYAFIAHLVLLLS
jgi:hypothetical protein